MEMIHPAALITAVLLCTGGFVRAQEHEDIPGQRHAGTIDVKELKKEIDAMRVPNVAWRRIKWKTCLLEGLRASRRKNKPLILWVFIDLPVDDKRC